MSFTSGFHILLLLDVSVLHQNWEDVKKSVWCFTTWRALNDYNCYQCSYKTYIVAEKYFSKWSRKHLYAIWDLEISA